MLRILSHYLNSRWQFTCKPVAFPQSLNVFEVMNLLFECEVALKVFFFTGVPGFSRNAGTPKIIKTDKKIELNCSTRGRVLVLYTCVNLPITSACMRGETIIPGDPARGSRKNYGKSET